MTTQPVRPPLPPYLQPNAKSSSTAKSSQLSAVANATPVASRSSSRARPAREKENKTASDGDATSEKVTLSLIRRVLAPETGHATDDRTSYPPIEAILPPLTSSNEIDVQLITPDHVFVQEVVHIIAHCTRSLEGRLRQNDAAEILLDEIPTLVQRHVEIYRIACNKASHANYGTQPLQVYHTLNPHPALSPVTDPNSDEPSHDQIRNEATYRQLLVRGALAVLLPTEDLENASLRILVGDIIADLILGQAVAEKICEGWFLHGAITKVVEIIQARLEPKASGAEIHQETRSRLEEFGLLSNRARAPVSHSSKSRQSRPSAWFWQAMQWIYMGFIFLRFILVGMFQSRRLPRRYYHAPTTTTSSPIRANSKLSTAESAASPMTPVEPDPSPRPILTYGIFKCTSTLLDLSARMPWLASTFAFAQNVLISGAGRFGSANSTLDKFLHHTIAAHILPSSILPTILLNLRANVFPNNVLGPSAQPPPSTDEARRYAGLAILTLIPPFVARTFFASPDSDDWLAEIEDTLSAFDNKMMNKHLVYGILELILARLIPELTTKTPRELLVDRIGEEKLAMLSEGEGVDIWEDEDDGEGDARMEAMKYFGDTV